MKQTINQKTAFNKIINKVQQGKKVELGPIMRESGYSEQTSRDPKKNLIEKKGFQELLAQIDDGQLLSRLNEIAFKSDARASLTAIDMLAKLKDLYPASKSKVIQQSEALLKIME